MQFSKPWFRKQNKTWYVTINGKQRLLGKDKEKALEEYAKLIGNQHEPEDNVRRLLNKYWDWSKTNHAESTRNKMRPRLESFGGFISPLLTTKKLRPHHVQNWLAEKFPDAGATYRNTLITTIKGALNWAASMGYIDRSPIAAMKKPAPKVRQEFVSAVEWPKVLAEATDDCFRDFLIFMFASGARVQEMLRIEARHYKDGKIVFPNEESKGRRVSRVIYLPDDAKEIIERRITEGVVFRNRNGQPWTADAINCRFRRMRDRLGVKKLCATTLRHSFAHHRLTNGQDSMVVAKLMGHADGRMLATRYGHLEANSEFMQSEANRVRLPTAATPSEIEDTDQRRTV